MASGGKNASLEAILDGHGGQHRRQQSSLRAMPFMIVTDNYKLELERAAEILFIYNKHTKLSSLLISHDS